MSCDLLLFYQVHFATTHFLSYARALLSVCRRVAEILKIVNRNLFFIVIENKLGPSVVAARLHYLF